MWKNKLIGYYIIKLRKFGTIFLTQRSTGEEAQRKQKGSLCGLCVSSSELSALKFSYYIVYVI